MGYYSDSLNRLIDKYPTIITRNGRPIKVFKDEVRHFSDIVTILIFCREKSQILSTDIFTLNDRDYTIKDMMHHSSNHYEVLLQRLNIPTQNTAIIVYDSSITFNNCNIATTATELLQTKQYNISSTKPISINGVNVFSSTPSIVITLAFNDTFKIGTILELNNNKLEVMGLENVNLNNISHKLFCKQITNINVI